jgi:hypothetical protein
MNKMTTRSLQQQLDLEANHQGIEGQIKNNHENGREYEKFIKTPYWNLMLNRQVLRTKERHVRHKLFLPREVVRCEIWTGGFQKKHSYRQRFPRRDTKLNTHPNE